MFNKLHGCNSWWGFSADMKRQHIPFWSVSLWKYWDVSMGVPRTNTCQQKVRNWIDKQSWWWGFQNCCTTLLRSKPQFRKDSSASVALISWKSGENLRWESCQSIKWRRQGFPPKEPFGKMCFCNEVEVSSPLLSQSCFAQNSVQPFTSVQCNRQVYSSTDFGIVCILILLNLGIFSMAPDYDDGGGEGVASNLNKLRNIKILCSPVCEVNGIYKMCIFSVNHYKLKIWLIICQIAFWVQKSVW